MWKNKLENISKLSLIKRSHLLEQNERDILYSLLLLFWEEIKT
jgi:hypothetical protein